LTTVWPLVHVERPFDGNTTLMTTLANVRQPFGSSTSVVGPAGWSTTAILRLVAIEVHNELTHQVMNMSYLGVVQMGKGKDLFGLR